MLAARRLLAALLPLLPLDTLRELRSPLHAT